LAAAGALILAILFLLGILSVIVDDPLGFPLAFVSVFTITFFGWFFVTTRGYRRLLGVPAILLALVALFIVAYDHKVALPVLIVVLALFGLCPICGASLPHADAYSPPACAPDRASTQRGADHQPQLRWWQGGALQPFRGGTKAEHRALAARA
jgi:hypothetical protein